MLDRTRIEASGLGSLELFELAYHHAEEERDELRRELRELLDQVRKVEQRIARKSRLMRDCAERFPLARGKG